MAELIDWFNLALSLDTNRAVHTMAQGQSALAEAERRRQLDNSVVNEVVDLYAKARDLRQRGELLGSFTLAITAKAKYYDALPGVKDANLKMQLIAADEKLNGELSQLMIAERIPGIVNQLGALLKSQIENAQAQVKAFNEKIGKTKNLDDLWGAARMLSGTPGFLLKYFDAGLAGPLGTAEPTWRAGVSALERTYSPSIQALKQETEKALLRWQSARTWRRRSVIIGTAGFWVLLLTGVVLVLRFLMKI